MSPAASFLLLPYLSGLGFLICWLYFKKRYSQVRKDVQVLSSTIEEYKKGQVRLQSSVDSLNVGFIITDQGGQILNINPAAKMILCQGRTLPKGVNVNDPNLVNLRCGIDDIARLLSGTLDIRTQIQACLSQKKTVDIPSLEYRKLFLHINITPVVTLKKQPGLELEFIGVVILIEDITENKILDRAKNELFSIASHELKTPLSVIKGNAEMLKRLLAGQMRDGRMLRMVDDIFLSSSDLITIVDDFLDVSRLEQGRIKFNIGVFDLQDLVKKTVGGYRVFAAQKNLYLAAAGVNHNLFVSADFDRTRQVLINLLSNALKFTHQGGVTVEVGRVGDFARVAVSDTGIGIPPQAQNLIFRKFQQANEDLLTRETARGTGVGLYICKLLCQGMGGFVRLECSEPGEGSIFAFYLPVVATPVY